MSIKICKLKTANIKEALTGVLDYLSSVKAQVFFTEFTGLSLYFFLFICLFICQSVFCGRKWLNITGLVHKSLKSRPAIAEMLICI